MRRVSDSPALVPSGIDGISDSGPEENFRPGLFGEVARLVYPGKTDAILAVKGHKSDRAARAWMAGTAMPPPIVLVKFMADLIKQAFR